MSWIGIISFGFFLFLLAVLFLGFLTVVLIGLSILKNGSIFFGQTFIVSGILMMTIVSYLVLAKYSKGAYSVLSCFESYFYTGVTYEPALEIRQDKDGVYLAYHKDGNLYTGFRRSFFDKLRLNPVKAKANGFEYYYEGQLLGHTQTPDEPLAVSYSSPSSLLEADDIQNAGIAIPIHQDYEKVLREETQTWGDYVVLDTVYTAFNQNYKIRYAVCVCNGKIIKKEISFHKNGIIASITPYYPDQFDQWNTGKGNYLTFDSLGYLIKREPWHADGTIDYQNSQKEDWSLENFVFTDSYADGLFENECWDMDLRKKLLSPDRPDFLKHSEKWQNENRNFDNFYLMFGGTTDYKTPVGIGLYYNRDWYPLSREQGEIFASALAAGKLISTADEAVIDYPKKKFMFVLLLDGQEVCRFLLKNDKFYMDNGLYAISLIPKDGENEDQQFCMEQERIRLHRMLEEITGESSEAYYIEGCEPTK